MTICLSVNVAKAVVMTANYDDGVSEVVVKMNVGNGWPVFVCDDRNDGIA
jgi:hypothetical protein